MRRVALALLVLAAEWRTAQACICAPSYREPDLRACAETDGSSSIFVGTVVSIKKTGVFDTTTFAVLEAFRGVTSPTVETIGGDSNCDAKFGLGRSYFVYASPHPTHPDRLGVRGCGGTQQLEAAAPDLAYARAGGHKKRVLLGGSVQFFQRATALDHRDMRFLAAVPVTVRGPGGTRLVVTDTTGFFRIDDPTPGAYTIHADLPPPFRALPDQTVTIKDGDCGASIAFIMDALAEIHGRVIDENGHPRPRVTVTARPIGMNPKVDVPRGETDALGEYVIRWLAPGAYVLAVKREEQLAPWQWPYPDTILAGVVDVAGPFDRKVDDLVIAESSRGRVDK